MKKLALLFLLAIFAPAVLLGVLAVRTASRQRIIMQTQEVELRQKETDELAAQISVLLADEQRSFLDAVDRLRAHAGTQTLASGFARDLPKEWGRDCTAFAVGTDGVVLSSTTGGMADTSNTAFLSKNGAFLANRAPAEVYQPAAAVSNANVSQSQQSGRGSLFGSIFSRGSDRAALADAENASKVSKDVDKAPDASTAGGGDAVAKKIDVDNAVSQKLRTVMPQYQQAAVPARPAASSAQPVSQLYYATSKFRELIGDAHDGVLARFVDDELAVIFWVRPAGLGQYVLGAQMKASSLFDSIRPNLPPLDSRDACIAVLDDRARPVFLSQPGFTAAWKSPFVATEIGEALPHWETALYLRHPDSVSQSARLITLTLYGIVGLAVGAIGWGSLLIAADTRRQVRLAQKKTDFVSNVSHELKTPLTSIRMFAELLHERRVSDPAKVNDYLRIIRLEAERLTRLINNVLDFARLERNQKHYTRRLTDLRPEIERLWEGQAEHLRAQGFTTSSDITASPLWADVDPDAITQVIVNLLANAEKYSGATREVGLRAAIDVGTISISVLDRGTGVPSGEERKIFESFYRAHDSLSSGIPGSGLGLTLAQHIAGDHGGDIQFQPRPGGGSIFTLRIPAHPSPVPA